MDRAIVTEPESDLVRLGHQVCFRSRKSLRQGWSFGFKANPASAVGDVEAGRQEVCKCISCAVRHLPMLRRSLMVAAVVGTIITLLNQGDIILAGYWKTVLYWKIPLSYCVPFCVATYGALSNTRR